ncbi:MAG: methyltransferase domain-containing protein [Gemmatimonadaceae bacterium]|nr:methyltransferase domain-containing protein [Gemmatimonadaceae bacterium]
MTGRSEWWETFFDQKYLDEYEPHFGLENDRREVARLVDILELHAGARVLDAPSGQGRHSHLLAEAGFDVDGLDYSRVLINAAEKRGTGPNLRYTVGDMRKMPNRWRNRFDAVLNLFTSFGFFDHPDEDELVVKEFARVLRPGGVLIWQGGSRDGIMAQFLSKDWWRGGKNRLYAQQRSFDQLSGILTVRSTWSEKGKVQEREHRIRLYNASQLSEMFRRHGLVVEQAFDGRVDRPLTRRSSEMLLVARKATAERTVK